MREFWAAMKAVKTPCAGIVQLDPSLGTNGDDERQLRKRMMHKDPL